VTFTQLCFCITSLNYLQIDQIYISSLFSQNQHASVAMAFWAKTYVSSRVKTQPPHTFVISICNITWGLKIRLLLLLRYCDGFSILQFFNSAVAYEFALSCKVVAQFLCRFINLIQNILPFIVGQNCRLIKWLMLIVTQIFWNFLHDFLAYVVLWINPEWPQVEKKIFWVSKK